MIDSGKKVELLDPKIDYVFKRIFGEKGDEDILMSLINAILKGNPTIKELELLNTEYPKEGADRKGCRFDILAKTDNDVTINIEMQYRNDKYISDRIIYYSDRIFVEEYKEGDFYGNKKVISIWIFAENLTRRKKAISEIFPTFKENGEDNWEVVSENQRIIILELNKYKTTNDNFKDLLTNWVNFLKTPEYLENNPLKIENNELDKAIDKLEIMSKNDQEMYYIQSIKDYERDIASEKYWESVEARNKGLKEGLDNGLKKKKKKGLDKGLKEGKIEMVRNMLKDNVDINIISKYSGLSIDEIKNIEK